MHGQGSPQVLVAPDKFKGTLTAAQAARSLAAGMRAADPSVDVRVLPVADGGEGTVDAAVSAGFSRHVVAAVGPTGSPVRACIALRDGTAVVEAAAVSGLALLPGNVLEPLTAHSYGVGQVVIAALDRGADEIVLGLGGTACTDGGTAMLRALGARFLDRHGDEVPLGGAALAQLHRIDTSGVDPRVQDARFVVASDVDCPLLGPEGAARMFGPQKGADAAEVELLERGLDRLAAVVAEVTGERYDARPGAGAAGGLGFAGLAFLSAAREPGARFVLDLLGVPSAVRDADLVVTGEGRLDEQSLHGKAPAEVAAVARAGGSIAVAAVGSCALAPEAWSAAGFAAVYELMTLAADAQTARRDAARLLSMAGEQIVHDDWVRASRCQRRSNPPC